MGPDAPDPAQIQHRLQERRQPDPGGMVRTYRDDLERFMVGLPPEQYHQGRLWDDQEDVRQPPPAQEAHLIEPEGVIGGGIGHNHRSGRALARKKRQLTH